MLNLLDDCSRLFTGSKIYERELLLHYFDFLPAAFLAHGRPLQIYVDYHSLFFTHDPDALTQLGWALKFYDISFLYAPTPQAKGKIERAHQYWQGRPPAYFASEKITEIEVANPHIDALRAHRNARGIKPAKKNAPPCSQRPAARGGIIFGACALPSESAPMAACRSARSGYASKNHPKPRSCFVSTLPATTLSWPLSPITSKNPRSSSPIAPNNLSCFANYKNVLL